MFYIRIYLVIVYTTETFSIWFFFNYFSKGCLILDFFVTVRIFAKNFRWVSYQCYYLLKIDIKIIWIIKFVYCMLDIFLSDVYKILSVRVLVINSFTTSLLMLWKCESFVRCKLHNFSTIYSINLKLVPYLSNKGLQLIKLCYITWYWSSHSGGIISFSTWFNMLL